MAVALMSALDFGVLVHSLLSHTQLECRLQKHGRGVRPRPPYPLSLPAPLVRLAEEHLRQNGKLGVEQLVLWGGYPSASGVVVTSLFLPETIALPGWVAILPDEQPLIATWLHEHGQLLFAEAHTHGEGIRATEISTEDCRYPVGRQEGFLTIIVPDYARGGIDLHRAGIWEYRDREWARLPGREVARRLRVVSKKEALDRDVGPIASARK